MLGNSKHMFISREGDIQSNGFRASWLRICVSTETLLPPCAFVFADRLLLLVLFLLLFLALFLFLGGFLDLGPPMLQVQKATLVESDLGFPVPLKVDAEGRMLDDGLVLTSMAVEDAGISIPCFFTQGCTVGYLKTANKSPFPGLVVTLLPYFAVVAESDVTFLSPLLIQRDTGDTRFEEGNSERKSDLLLAVLQRLYHNGMQLSILEGDGGRVKGIRRGPGSSCGSGIGKCTVAFAKAGLVTLLEVFVLDGYCRKGELSDTGDG